MATSSYFLFCVLIPEVCYMLMDSMSVLDGTIGPEYAEVSKH